MTTCVFVFYAAARLHRIYSVTACKRINPNSLHIIHSNNMFTEGSVCYGFPRRQPLPSIHYRLQVTTPTTCGENVCGLTSLGYVEFMCQIKETLIKQLFVQCRHMLEDLHCILMHMLTAEQTNIPKCCFWVELWIWAVRICVDKQRVQFLGCNCKLINAVSAWLSNIRKGIKGAAYAWEFWAMIFALYRCSVMANIRSRWAYIQSWLAALETTYGLRHALFVPLIFRNSWDFFLYFQIFDAVTQALRRVAKIS